MSLKFLARWVFAFAGAMLIPVLFLPGASTARR
jgi:hypothetical protein